MRSRIYVISMLLFGALLAAVSLAQGGETTTRTVTYLSGSEKVSGYLARPSGKGPYPALVVIHEWWGLDEWIKRNAREFAERGYVALAVDLYRGKVAADAELAHELSRALPEDRAVRDLTSALAYLRRQPYVDKGNVGSIGWCMGGGYSLQLALNADLAATVIAYGRLVTDPGLIARIGSPVLGVFADQDRGIPADTVRAFEASLEAEGVENRILIYEGVGHAFMNPNNSKGYSAEAAGEAWEEIYDFLDGHLMGGTARSKAVSEYECCPVS